MSEKKDKQKDRMTFEDDFYYFGIDWGNLDLDNMSFEELTAFLDSPEAEAVMQEVEERTADPELQDLKISELTDYKIRKMIEEAEYGQMPNLNPEPKHNEPTKLPKSTDKLFSLPEIKVRKHWENKDFAKMSMAEIKDWVKEEIELIETVPGYCVLAAYVLYTIHHQENKQDE